LWERQEHVDRRATEDVSSMGGRQLVDHSRCSAIVGEVGSA
jgi:hypothetical protein